jgi:hypothetical protein
MDELINHITAATGVDRRVARRATGIIIGFLSREGPPEAVNALLDDLPGSRDLLAESGHGSRGLMGVFGDLTAAGLGLGEIRGVAGALLGYARAKAGSATVDAVVAAIPGLSQFV